MIWTVLRRLAHFSFAEIWRYDFRLKRHGYCSHMVYPPTSDSATEGPSYSLLLMLLSQLESHIVTANVEKLVASETLLCGNKASDIYSYITSTFLLAGWKR